MPTVAWTLLAGLGFWQLRQIPKAKHKTIKAVLVRSAAIFFLVAGTISAGGWIGSALRAVVGVAGQIGAGIIWVLWFCLALSWLAGMVPETWFRGQVPDWLSLSGLLLPALLAAVPGPVGAGIHTATQATSSMVGTLVGQLFGVTPKPAPQAAAAALHVATAWGAAVATSLGLS